MASQVSLTFAGDAEIPQEINNILMTDNEYYLIKDVMISEFYDQSFIELFVQKGIFILCLHSF